MAKAKKKGISDVKLGKSSSQKKKQNPFEVHINREKFKVLGKKSNFDRGLPGVARAKAIKKRKETLLQEYKIQDKSNKFIDRRIGERNKSMTKEDRIIARFTAERMKAHKRKTMFNLAEEEVLTHKGRSITEVERFDDPRSDDDEDDERQSGNLGANFVEEAHFGGGMFTKSKNSRESVIDQLIADSKKRKFERQQMKEKTLELTEKLDTEWRDLVPLINSGNQQNEEENEPTGRVKRDPYDITLTELKFEARGIPCDKLKSEEQIAEEEAEKLEKLEEERLRRMRGDDTQVTVTKRQHRSADALEDNFQLDEEEFSLMYDKDGNIIAPKIPDGDDEENQEAIIIKPVPDQVDESDDDEEVDDQEDDDESEEDDDDETIQDLKTEIEACNQKENEDSEEESSDEFAVNKDKINRTVTKAGKTKNKTCISGDKKLEYADEDSVNDDDILNSDEKDVGELENESEPENDEYLESLLKKYSISEDTDENLIKPPNMLVLTTVPKKRKVSETVEGSHEPPVKKSSSNTSQKLKEVDKKNKKVCFNEQVEEVKFGENSLVKSSRTTEDIREDLMKRKELMDKARKELPYTYQAPKSYEDLQEFFKDRDDNEITVVVERIIKCNHPKLREENKLKMTNLFAFLMQYLNDLDHEKSWQMLDRLIPFLYELMMFSPSNIAECIVEILKEKQSDYTEKKYKYPGCSTLVFLKLVPLLFPPSDKRHPVTTPALVFLTQMLQNCKVTNRRSIATGLFIVSLIYEYVYLSKRICPQVINFLVGLLHLASPANVTSHVIPPFKEDHRFLYLHSQFSSEISDWKLTADEISVKSSKIDDTFRVKSLYLALNLLDLYVDIYNSHSACYLLFTSLNSYLSSLEVKKYPTVIRELVSKVNKKLDRIFSEKLEKLTVASKKPKVLRLYEPAIEPVYDTKKKKGVSAEKSERDKLLHKIKRERKGALREIRRDRAFISKIKFKQQQQSDAERMKKVKQIYSWGALQQGEMNAFNRLKNKKR